MGLLDKHYVDQRFLDIVLALLLNLLIFSTNNVFMKYTKHIALGFIVVSVLYAYLRSEGSAVIKINRFKLMYLLFFLLVLYHLLTKTNTDAILDYSIFLILGLNIIFIEYSADFYYYFIKILKGMFWIFIFSMFLEAVYPSIFHAVFSLLAFGNLEFRAMVSGGAIAGIAFEKAYAAFLCNLGMGIVLGEFLIKRSAAVMIQVMIVLTALMMTGKRTLFIIPIIIILAYVILFSHNNRFIKVAGIGLTGAVLIVIIYTVVPQAALIINRLTDNSGNLLSGRENFWKYAMDMFHMSPVFGEGFLSFNEYTYVQGFRYYGERWNYQAHNVYIQLLGEMGITGFLLITGLIGSLLHKAIRWAKESKGFGSGLMVYWVILFAIYSLTGNTLYYPCQLVILFICILFLSNKYMLEGINWGR